MSKVWQYLNVDNYQDISDEVYNFISTHTDLLSTKVSGKNYFYKQDVNYTLRHCPLLVKFLTEQQLAPTLIGIIICNNQEKLGMHRDLDGLTPYIRILWPVRNCQGSKTQFWKVPEGSGILTSDSNGVLFTDFPSDQEREFLDELDLTAPALVDVSIPHSVEPNPKIQDDRISLSIGFDRDLPISKSIKAWFGFRR